jgi:very-short-patch-repair endonuclease/signal recognition particle subunit SEC65
MHEKHNLEMLKEHATSVGGECLSVEYVNNHTRYVWLCGSCNHQWLASWYNVNCHNSWCPNCKVSQGETIARRTFKECFPDEEFKTNRDVIGVEIDGYSPSLKLGFEYDGVQHRKLVPTFHKTEQDFLNQQTRDKAKDRLCEEAGITLIRIPDSGVVKYHDIREHIVRKLQESKFAGTIIPIEQQVTKEAFDALVVQDRAGHVNNNTDKYTADFDKLLPDGYTRVGAQVISPSAMIEVRCDKGHIYETHVDNLKRGRKCPKCSPTRKQSDEEIKAMVEERGYQYISHERVKNDKGKSRLILTMQCENPDHPNYVALSDNFKKGKNCSMCSHKQAGPKISAAKKGKPVPNRVKSNTERRRAKADKLLEGNGKPLDDLLGQIEDITLSADGAGGT